MSNHPKWVIGTNGPKGQVWVLAALSLPYKERIEAMADIADMLGTSFAMVQSVASKLKAKQHNEITQERRGRRQPYPKPDPIVLDLLPCANRLKPP